jgi:hypothetical protein
MNFKTSSGQKSIYKYQSKASKASPKIVSFSRQLLCSSHLLINKYSLSFIFFAAAANVSSRTSAILYKVIDDSAISG